MQLVSATEYVSCGDLQHTRTVTERCSKCGYEKQHTETENHVFSSDESTHECTACGEKSEHDYSLIQCKWETRYLHVSLYECKVCKFQKEVADGHSWAFEQLYIIDENLHCDVLTCTKCSVSIDDRESPHVLDENGMCFCGYHRGWHRAPLPGEGLPENSGDLTEALHAFCHLTTDGKEILYGYALEPTEDGDAIGLILFPESAPENADFEVLFPVSKLEHLQVLGVKNIYLRLNGNDILLLNDIEQTLTILSEQETDELLIILTPGSDGAYTTQYDPADVIIME